MSYTLIGTISNTVWYRTIPSVFCILVAFHEVAKAGISLNTISSPTLRRRQDIMVNHKDQRRHLDLLFLTDSFVSLVFGTAALVTPYGLLQKIGGGGCIIFLPGEYPTKRHLTENEHIRYFAGEYSHSAHEILR